MPEGIDGVLYLPFDTSANVRHFLDTIRPACAVFMVSEYWHNYLTELHRRGIPAYLVSSVIRESGPFSNGMVISSVKASAISMKSSLLMRNHDSC